MRWQAQPGRNHLPWQATRDPYRVWLSEIMLQQTQVATVLGYYSRFLAALPDVAGLAAASTDDVMALWSGLGYYSRARNLHRCAQAVMASTRGNFRAAPQCWPRCRALAAPRRRRLRRFALRSGRHFGCQRQARINARAGL